METVLAIFLGLSLSATCGFRVFVPLLVVSVATWSGHVTPAEGFAWLGSEAALIALSVATLLEIGAYLIPWLDHALDVMALPLAGIAGAVLTASFVHDMSPFLKWTLAVVAGGGLAMATHTMMATARAGSTAASGGLLNPVLSLTESATAFGLSALAVAAPVLAFFLVGFLVLAAYFAARGVGGFLSRRFAAKSAPAELI